MAGETPYKPDWKTKLVAELSRDKRKTVILAVLLLLGVVVGMRLVFKTNPAAAQAKAHTGGAGPAPQVKSPTPSVATVTTSQLGNDARIQERIQANARRIDRDLFVPDAKAFPPEPVQPKKAKPDGAAKSTTKTPEQVVQELAAEFTLQSTIISAEPTAIIDGRILKLGDTISGFMVVGITKGTCDLLKDDVLVELVMERDDEPTNK